MKQSIGIEPIRTLLIANRGEIAVRVMRTARAMGIRTVAVYSAADANSPHVEAADSAVCIGQPAPRDSYLNIPAIIAAAQASGADAIHPGYGFLAENEAFAQACAEANIRFVGPSADAIFAMGDKAQAKQRMRVASIPCIPGYDGDDQSPAVLTEQARQIGFPIMIKASAGGGGRGMRRVDRMEDWDQALGLAQSEALTAFGDSRVILERALIRPRHIEIQILADSHGHTLYLGERDCSIQRRHQKIVEEAPSPAVSPELRQRMGEVAVRVAELIHYTGAGTIEFLLDEAGEFYFMEMNTRLQVEHPVTEAITGLDLVEWQLRIAEGEALTLRQQDIALNGHAIEVRLCAEDPASDFLPQTGKVRRWLTSPIARTDHALRDGHEVSPWYDSMLAKIIVHAPTREQACLKMLKALNDTQAVGIKTNLSFLSQLIAHKAFVQGATHTHFINDHFADNASRKTNPTDLHWAIAAVFSAAPPAPLPGQQPYPEAMHGFNSTGVGTLPVRIHLGEQARKGFVERLGKSLTTVWFNAAGEQESTTTLSFESCLINKRNVQTWQVACHGVVSTITVFSSADLLVVQTQDGTFEFTNARLARATSGHDDAMESAIKSPMNGRVVAIKQVAGDATRAKQAIVVLEAMKMEHSIGSKRDAVIGTIHVEVGQQVSPGQLLVTLVANDSKPAESTPQ